MDAFSYLSVLLSIILGLAITQVLQGYRALILARGRVKLAPTALIWSAVILVSAVQAWWASFGLRDHLEWSFATFAVILLQMILLYMQSAIVLPDPSTTAEAIDLDAHHEAHRRAFFGFLLGTIAASLLKDVMLDGSLPEPRNLVGQLIAAGLAVVGMVIADRRVQLAIALLAAAGLAIYIGLLFAEL
ncbi:hypothetical protein [Sphingomonas mesophila]|uniref:hypothetical protein n=1 Tax=Sphingomonas mesophila TaxID=2303576 RepID=UPI000E5731BD|nr:hypothetical protein [Sphingomonas mesophila]